MTTRFSVVVVAAMLLAASLAVPLDARAALPARGLAYDEVTKLILSAGTPEPGTFSADFDQAVSAQRSVASPGAHHGLFGSLMNAMDQAKNAMNMLKNGTASSKYYLGGWERTDDPGAQTAEIAKPQLHQIIFLNLAKKTYRIVDTNVQAPAVTPPPMESARNPSGQPPQPGSGKLAITVSSVALGSRTIENAATVGYKQTFSLSETESTGSCTNGNFQTSVTDYVSQYAQPQVYSPGAAIHPQAQAAALHPELMALKAGCAPQISMHASGTARPSSDRLSLWTLIEIGAGAPTAQGQTSGGFSTLIERGNVRVLGPSDKSLFEIPADFTKEP